MTTQAAPLTAKQQIIKYSRMAIGLVRVARSSRSPRKLIASAEAMADKLNSVAKTLPVKDAVCANRCALMVDAMLNHSFGARR